jgi:hypothetical protein
MCSVFWFIDADLESRLLSGVFGPVSAALFIRLWRKGLGLGRIWGNTGVKR